MSGIEGAPKSGEAQRKTTDDHLDQVFEQQTGVVAGIGNVAEKMASEDFERRNAQEPETILKRLRRAASRWGSKTGF